MLFSLVLMVLCAIVLSRIMESLRLPGLIGMLLTGIILGPYALNLISPELLSISVDLRKIALIIILLRAGLAINITDLKKIGRPALFLCFIPATFEIAAVTIFAPMLFQITRLEATIMGAVLAAVSPAVVIPRMLTLMENGYGKNKSIPQLMLSGVSLEGVYAVILVSSFIGIYGGDGFDFINIIKIPISIIAGALLGASTGFAFVYIFKKIHIRDTIKILIIIIAALLFMVLEVALEGYFPVSGLLATMALGISILKQCSNLAKRFSAKLSKIWVVAEIMLFVLVGAAVNVGYAASTGFSAILLILIILLTRICAVFICLTKTELNMKEKAFCAITYLPKATVQAAIGGLPLAAGVESGATILAVAVLAIVITAPIGAIGIDMTFKKLITRSR